MRTDIIENAAYKMFEHEFTNLGWDVEWCKSMFKEAGKLHIVMAEIAFKTLEEIEEAEKPHCEVCGRLDENCSCMYTLDEMLNNYKSDCSYTPKTV
jgi:hypothetical protein